MALCGSVRELELNSDRRSRKTEIGGGGSFRAGWLYGEEFVKICLSTLEP